MVWRTNPDKCKTILYSPKTSRQAHRHTQSPIQLVPENDPVVQPSVRYANQTVPSTAEFGNKWRYTSTIPICPHGVYSYLLMMTVSCGKNVDWDVLCKHAEYVAK